MFFIKKSKSLSKSFNIFQILRYNAFFCTNSLSYIFYTGFVPVSMNTASLAYVGGFLIKVLEREVTCAVCISELTATSCTSKLLHLIKNQDTGSLKYPSTSLIYILDVIKEFCNKVFDKMPPQGIYKNVEKSVVARLSETLVKVCAKQGHSIVLSQIICSKFMKPMLENLAKNKSDLFGNVRFLSKKPVSRKVLKFS